MRHNFDKVIDRRQTPSYKWNPDFLKNVFGTGDVQPMWVADMDFEVSPAISEAIVKRTAHGVFGYEYKTDNNKESLMDWYKNRHQWSFAKKDLLFAPSVLTAIAVILETLTEQGDGVIVQTPVYHQFFSIIKNTKRKVVRNPLTYKEGRYAIDFDDLREKAKDPATKVLLLSNPHNPVGRVWTKEELQIMGLIAKENDLIIISDDIHADIIHKGYTYTPMASLSEDLAQSTITCLSPGKTFNLSGISTAAMVVENPSHKEAMEGFMNAFHINATNTLSMTAFEAAYKEGGPWFDDFMAYMEGNLQVVKDFIQTELKDIHLVETEGTYLVWLDLSAYKMEADALQKHLVSTGKLGLDAGHWFGREGSGFFRLNMATPRVHLEKALENLKFALDQLA